MAVSIAKVTAAKASSYYYSNDQVFNENGENNNLTWSGKQAEELGLSGSVDQSVFTNILEGKSPNGEAQLRNTDNTTGNQVAALDLPFSSPKSVSLLAMNDKSLIEAHDRAVTKALEYAENNLANIKKTVDTEDTTKSRIIENQGNLLIARANHGLARPTEEDPYSNPSLHTHAIIINSVKNNDTGEYRALASKELFDNQKTLDQIYKSELAKEVVKLGYQLETKSHGWDIKMEQEVIDKFSSRHNEIMEKAEETGAQTYKDIQKIQHENKSEKADYSLAELKNNWNEKLNEVGYKSFSELSDNAKGETKFSFSSEKEVLEKSVSLLTQNESVLTERQVLKVGAEISVGQYSYMDLKAELDSVKKIGMKEHDNLKLLGVNDKNERVFTNLEMHNIEKENAHMIKNQDTTKALMSPEHATTALKDFEDKNFTLSEGQFKTAHNILSSNDSITSIQGSAGSGKTLMLKAINHSMELQNTKAEALILSPTNKAAQGAAMESKLDSGKSFEAQTIAKFISNAKNSSENVNEASSQKIIIIDESSMLSSRDMNTLLKAKEDNHKLVFMGDTSQLQSIAAGRAFGELQQETKVSEMKEVRRQQNSSEREIAHNVRSEKTMDRTFKELDRSGKIFEIKDEDKRLEAVAISAVKKETLIGEKSNGESFSKEVNYKNNLIVSATREENQKLNNLVRDKLHSAGEINKNEHIKSVVTVPINMSAVKQTKAASFEKGQQVTTFNNVKGIRKSTQYEVLKTDKTNNTLLLKSKDTNNKDIFTKIDLKEAAGKINITEKQDREFSKGDIVIVSITDKKNDLLNSDRGIVVEIDKKSKTMKVDFGEDKGVKKLDMKKEHGLDFGYSSTVFKSQGMSIDRIQSHVNTDKGTDLNSFHVQQTRQKLKSEVFTNDISKLKELASKEQVKTSSTDFVEKTVELPQNKEEYRDKIANNLDFKDSQEVKVNTDNSASSKSANEDMAKSDNKSVEISK